MKEDPNSTLLRSVRVLFGLVEAGRPMTVSRLANAVDLPASTAHRILNVLRQGDYVTQDADTGAYSPGGALLRMAALMASSSEFPPVVNAMLRELVEKSGESAFYGAFLGEVGRLKFVANLHSHHALQYVMRTDQTYSLLWGASGRSIAAFLPQTTVRELYAREKDLSEGTAPLPQWDDLWSDLQQIRGAGYCTTNGKRFEGSHAIAAPIRGADDAIIGCIGISMPSARREPAKTEHCVTLVLSAATQLSSVARCAIGTLNPDFGR